MKFTQASNIGLHAMTYLVQQPAGQNLTIHQLAAQMQVSPTYLAKILAQLVKVGLITSVPGVKGGYRPARNAQAVTFADVIAALDGKPDFRDGLAGDSENCQIASTMQAAEAQMWHTFSTRRLSDLAPLVKK